MTSPPRIREDFVVRDGHVYVPAWEWSTEETSILGFPCFTYALPKSRSVLLSFPYNDQALVWSWEFWKTDIQYGAGVIAIWEKPNADLDNPTMWVESLDRLLGVIRTLAERPKREG